MIEITSASVMGQDHFGPRKNNQDAVETRLSPEDGVAVGVVCDGCGSGKHSEVGAKIGANLISGSLVRWLSGFVTTCDTISDYERRDRYAHWRVVEILDRVRQDTLSQIRVLANSMGEAGRFSEIIQEYFLFTAVGAVVTPYFVFTFSVGDGVMFVNGDRIALESNEQNAPSYLAYDIVDAVAKSGAQLRPRISLNAIIRRDDFSSLLLGTDGALALLDSATKKMPGKDEPIGDISSLWKDDKFFKNGDALRRHLALVNRTVESIDWKSQIVNKDGGYLKDDTSIVVIRDVKR